METTKGTQQSTRHCALLFIHPQCHTRHLKNPRNENKGYCKGTLGLSCSLIRFIYTIYYRTTSTCNNSTLLILQTYMTIEGDNYVVFRAKLLAVV